MKCCWNVILFLFFSACAFPTALAQSSDPSPKPSEMTVWRARRVLTCGPTGLCPNVKFTDDGLSFEVQRSRNQPPERLTIDLKSLDRLSAVCKEHGFGLGKYFNCDVQSSDGKNLDRHDPVKRLFMFGYWGMAPAGDANAVALVNTRGEAFVSALNRLREFAIHPESPLRNFSTAATEWRALSTKPPLSAEARVHRLIAEDEVKKKHPELALFHYEAALETQATWPEGYFNAALIAAELELYGQAAEHMQSYLELTPNAQDAQTARDQIAMWQYKAKNK